MAGTKRFAVLRWIAIVVVALLLAVYGLWQLSRARDFQLFGKLVSHVETTEKVVALTFDDGPSSRFTPVVLDLLKAKDVKATFFVIGQDAASYPDQARAIVEAGHELGNHTYTHSRLIGWDKVAGEIEKTDAAVRAAGHTGEIFFRPPYGKKLVVLPLYLSQHDRTTVTWDVEPESDSRIASDPALITTHVLERVKPGSIVILHPMYASGEPTRQALPAIIDGLRERGYSFRTVSELLTRQDAAE